MNAILTYVVYTFALLEEGPALLTSVNVDAPSADHETVRYAAASATMVAYVEADKLGRGDLATMVVTHPLGVPMDIITNDIRGQLRRIRMVTA